MGFEGLPPQWSFSYCAALRPPQQLQRTSDFSADGWWWRYGSGIGHGRQQRQGLAVKRLTTALSHWAEAEQLILAVTLML